MNLASKKMIIVKKNKKTKHWKWIRHVFWKAPTTDISGSEADHIQLDEKQLKMTKAAHNTSRAPIQRLVTHCKKWREYVTALL